MRIPKDSGQVLVFALAGAVEMVERWASAIKGTPGVDSVKVLALADRLRGVASDLNGLVRNPRPKGPCPLGLEEFARKGCRL